MKLLNVLFAGALALGLTTTGALANADKGQKLFAKKLKDECGMSGLKWQQNIHKLNGKKLEMVLDLMLKSKNLS